MKKKKKGKIEEIVLKYDTTYKRNSYQSQEETLPCKERMFCFLPEIQFSL